MKSPSSSLFPFHLRREKEYSLYNNVFKPQPLPAAEDEIEMCLVQFRDWFRSLLCLLSNYSLALSLQCRAGGWVWLKCSCPLHLLTTSPPLLLTMQGWVLSSFLCPQKIRHYGKKCQKKNIVWKKIQLCSKLHSCLWKIRLPQFGCLVQGWKRVENLEKSGKSEINR